MKIYDATNKLILEIEVDDTSYRYRTIGGDHNLILKYSLPQHVELPVGAYVVFETQTYVLQRPQDFKMKHTRSYEYTVTFESPQANAKIWKFRNTVDGRLKFSLTAKPHEHLEMFVANMNRRDTGWSVGECIDGTEKCINYDHDYCWDAIGKMASEFNTEFEIKGKQVSLRKVEYNKSNPLPLSYGCGNGFQSGVGRSNSGDKPPIEILYVQGGTDNIDPSKYGNKELLLPKNQTISYDGEHFEDEVGYNAANARRYVVDDLGLSIRRADKSLSSLAEDSLDASEIYPKRIGTISQWLTVNKDGNLYDFVDNTIPSDLNYEDYLIEGETMTVIFQSGMLAGKEFEVKYYHDPITNKYDSSKNQVGRRFEIVPQDIDGETMPNEIFKAAVNDTYAVFNCALPDSYIRDDKTKTGASWDMFREAVKYLYDNEEEKYTFSGTLDGLWAKKDWVNIGGRIILGGFVKFYDKNFLQEGVLVRIVGIKDYVNNPHSPTIELSNETRSTSYGTQMAQLTSQEVAIDDNYKSSIQFTKRRWQDTKETISMLEEALLDNFTNRINPIAVETMSVLVGDESLQFRFVNNMTNPQVVNHVITYDQEELQLNAPAGIVQHMTLDIDTITSEHKPSEYKFWNVAQFTSAHLIDGTKSYYLYIKANRNNQSAVFELSESAHKMAENSSVYYFLVGILNKEFDGERSFVTLYGFTEILPGRVTTDRVVSGDGNSFFDLLGNAMKLGDRLSFNIDGDGQLLLKGTLVQSTSGQTEYLGCYRGLYNAAYTYYRGDEVIYTENNVTSLYRQINENPCKGIPPSNTSYWAVQAQGQYGNFVSTVFKRQNTKPDKPSGGSYFSPVPNGWYDGIPNGSAILWASVCTFYGGGGSSGWSEPAQETDTSTQDIEFSPSQNQPPAPIGNTPYSNHESEGWYDPNSKNFASAGQMIWRAERKVANGEYDGDWTITRIYGEKGDTGNYTELRYAVNGSTTSAPSLDKSSLNPTNWSTALPTVGTAQYLWMTKGVKTADGKTLVEQWSTPVRISAKDGKDGIDGEDGKSPVMVFRGTYDSSKTYYGNSNRLDCVQSGSTYYIARIDAGEFSGVAPTDTSKWNPFGASFESVATELLLAEHATIGNWFISGDKICSIKGTINGVASTNYGSSKFKPDIILDGQTGEVLMYNGNYPRIRISNQSVQTLFNENSVEKNNISQSYTKTGSPYHPPGSSTYNYTVGTIGTINLGTLTDGSQITISNVVVSMRAPGYQSKDNAITTSINGSDIKVNIKKDGTTVKTLSGGSGSSAQKGGTVSCSMEANGYSVPEDGGGGTYSLEIILEKVVFTSDGGEGFLDDISISISVSGSYVIGGYNRTVIGNDGIGSFYGDAMMVFTRNNFIARNGDYGLRVTSSGVQKTSSALSGKDDWTNL